MMESGALLLDSSISGVDFRNNEDRSVGFTALAVRIGYAATVAWDSKNSMIHWRTRSGV